MPVLPDLVTQPQLAAYLSGLELSPAQQGELPALAASASRAVRQFCRRAFTLTTFDELYTVDSPSRDLVLNQYPVATVSRVATNPTAVLTVANNDAATNQRAVVGLATTGDWETGLAVTGVTLTRWASGVAVVSPVPLATLHTVADLVAAINGVGGGWSALAATGYALWPVFDLAGAGTWPALNGNAASLRAHVDDLDYALDAGAGVLSLGTPSGDPTDSPRWGPAWPGEVADTQTYGGVGGVRVVYSAGYATVPADLTQYAAEVVKAAIERFEMNTSVKSESDGVLSWTARDGLLPIPPGVQSALSTYVNTRA
jgi:hypothetical protein